jgi:hypothetical protein
MKKTDDTTKWFIIGMVGLMCAFTVGSTVQSYINLRRSEAILRFHEACVSHHSLEECGEITFR